MSETPNKFAAALNAQAVTELTVTDPAETAPAPPKPARLARSGTKHIGGYFDPAVSRQLRAIALEEDSTVQQLLGEALDMLFHRRQKPMIASKPGGG